MRRAAQVDANQMQIVSGLRDRGITVLLLHTVGKGCPDILVGHQGRNYLFEIKSSAKAKLKPGQVEFFETWKGQKAIIVNLAEALKLLEDGWIGATLLKNV